MDHFNKSKDNNKPLTIIANYKLQRTLGKGGTGKVKLGVNQKTGEKVAVKIVSRANSQLCMMSEDGTMFAKEQLDEQREKEKLREVRTIREARIMRLLSHPNIIRLRGLAAIDSYIYILMDYVNGGQLLHYIIKKKKLSEKHARHFSRQIVSALDYMHHNSIVHRDLKIENILIDKKGENIKIIDFGLSNMFFPEKRLTTFCGSLYFAAPELLLAIPYKGPEVDIWSLGVVIYMMVTGFVPFDDESMSGLHKKIVCCQVNYPSHLSLDCQDLLSRIFVIDPSQRIILADLIRHPWMNNGFRKILKNHLPLRLPLTFPVSSDVIEKMPQIFNIGSVENIKAKLENIILSSTYQIAADHVSKMQHAQMEGKLERVLNMNANKWGPYYDPQSVPEAYHPFISLYHLTKENILQPYEEFESVSHCNIASDLYTINTAKIETYIPSSSDIILTDYIRSNQSTASSNDGYLSLSSTIVDTPLNTPALSDFELDTIEEKHSSKLDLRSLARNIASLITGNSKNKICIK